MKRLALSCMFFLPLAAWAQKQYFLPTASPSDDEKDKPMIEVYLPKEANGCAVVLCPGGAMRWLSWESDVVKMASFLNEHGIAAIGLRYHLNKAPMPQGMRMPPMVDVTHPEAFPQADANPMHNASGDSIIQLAAQDAKAAIRMVREHADEWHVSKDKIGYLGFSAGGGVAIAATMSADSMERPDFLCTNFGPSLMPVTVPQDAPPLLIMTRGGCRSRGSVHGVEEGWSQCRTPPVWRWQRPLRTDAADGRDYHRDMEHPDDSMVEGQEFSQPGIPGGCSAYITAGNYSSI